MFGESSASWAIQVRVRCRRRSRTSSARRRVQAVFGAGAVFELAFGDLQPSGLTVACSAAPLGVTLSAFSPAIAASARVGNSLPAPADRDDFFGREDFRLDDQPEAVGRAARQPGEVGVDGDRA